MAGGAIELRHHHSLSSSVCHHGRRDTGGSGQEWLRHSCHRETTGSSPQSGRGDRKLGAASGGTLVDYSVANPVADSTELSPQSCH